MGQKVNPNGFRLGVSKKQNANWYAKGKDFSNNLIQDLKERTGLPIHAVKIVKIDFLRDTASITIFYNQS